MMSGRGTAVGYGLFAKISTAVERIATQRC
ncbi:MAG: hypothetical protein RLZZ316_2170 [Bacteroidota bacterium]|jgi:hypothetical protein